MENLLEVFEKKIKAIEKLTKENGSLNSKLNNIKTIMDSGLNNAQKLSYIKTALEETK